MEVTVQGNYPAKIVSENPETGEKGTIAEVKYGNDGIPTTLYSYINLGADLIVDYIVKEGFLLMTSEVYTDRKTGAIRHEYKYTYNVHGHLASENRDGKLFEYSYEYDNKGNWVKCDGEEIINREYTYWE